MKNLTNSPMRVMMRNVRRHFVKLANGGDIGELVSMPGGKLLAEEHYRPRADFLEVADQPDHVFDAALEQTEYYRMQLEKRGEHLATRRMITFRWLLQSIKADDHDDLAHAPVVIVRNGKFVKRLDGTHRISVRRFLGQTDINVVAIEEDEYIEATLEQIPRDAVAVEMGSFDKWYQAIEILPGLWTRPNRDAKEGVLIGSLPDLSGRAVLDLGCNDGLYSFEAAMHGARSVLGVDRRPWAIEQADFVQAIWSVTRPGSGLPLFRLADILEHLELLTDVDTLIAACVLYHLGDGLHDFMRTLAASPVTLVVVQGNLGRRRKSTPEERQTVAEEGIGRDTPARLIFNVPTFTELFAFYGFQVSQITDGTYPVIVFERSK